ncbi:arsenate reductase [Polynucleobacter sp. SHI8]|uniref:arsenate reductase n=1 Tax=unclassified Polynucleobacter TaxID=2640945 RepID=UPI00308C55A8|nr:arsenate reductase [Polynucleobacter sp. SHI2]BDW13624.1 arsenate reductase [Polynucleobacter sp. SHI8]
MTRMPITLYGIPNCQTVKKARVWLESHQIYYQFYDFKKQVVNEELIQLWLKHVEWTQLINRSGMTYRNLTDQQKEQSQTQSGAISLMIQNPSMIKRPILEDSKSIYLGFKEADYQSIFGAL